MPVAFACRAAGGAVWSRYLATRGRQILGALGRRRAELSLSLIDDAEMRGLNRRYRAKDRPTDVLAFPLHEPPVPAGVASLGDVVISIETAAVAARQQRRSLARCLDALVIHGVLHLLGYDHEVSPAEARRMERQAAAVRAAIGVLPAPVVTDGARDRAPRPARRRVAGKARAR